MKYLNYILALFLILILILTIIPLSFKSFYNADETMGLSLIMFPILVPLSFCVLFGIITLFQYRLEINTFYLLFRVSHVIVIIVGAVSQIILHISPLFVFGLLFSSLSLINYKLVKYDKLMILTNSSILAVILIFLLISVLFAKNPNQSFIDFYRSFWF